VVLEITDIQKLKKCQILQFRRQKTPEKRQKITLYSLSTKNKQNSTCGYNKLDTSGAQKLASNRNASATIACN
jgi:hypothetical protein